MHKIILFISLVIWPKFAFGQFNLFVQGASTESIDVRIPSGIGDRYLLLLDRDSIRMDSIFLMGCSAGCNYHFEDLKPATIYLIQLFRNNSIEDERWIITASESGGLIEIYFTTTVDERVGNGFEPDGLGGEILENAIITSINNAHFSIDVMLYNINRRPISNALIAAHNRGVRIRYLTSDNTSNTALRNPTPPFPVLVGNLGDGLMHNKVFVIDADDPDRALLITGATNMTTGQIYTDHNNTLFIYDQSIARVFEKEIDEMWGSSGALPVQSHSRFGSSKLDDTPKEVYIHGTLFQIYFSPSDNTSFHIINTLNRIQESCLFSLMLITRRNLASALVNLHNRGVDVKGLVDDINASSSEFDFLRSNGVFALEYPGSRILHHKYAIGDPNGEIPFVITGSHNWTNSAETRNDENTLIIYNERIAQVYLMEFQARWCETFAGSNCLLVTNTHEQDFTGNSSFNVHYSSSESTLYVFPGNELPVERVVVFSAQGMPVYSAVQSGSIKDFSRYNLNGLTPGTYFISISSKSGNSTRSFIVP